MKLTDKTLLITGIGSFVGLRATEMAIARGMKVRGLSPSPAKAKAAEALGAEVLVGSVTEWDAIERACQGADIVFHLESAIEASGCLEEFRRVNVGGTVKTALAAQKAGVKTFLHLSSVMVYGFKYPDRATEEAPLRGENNPFCQSKIEAERELLTFNNPPDFGVILIRAGDIYGPGAYTWVLHPVELMAKHKFALVNGGRGIFNHLYLDNLIDAVFLAAEKEAYGEAFNITDGSQTTWMEFFSQLADRAGVHKPLSMPAFAMKTAAKTLGKQLGILPEAVDFISRSHSYSIEKARRILGYQPRVSLDLGMAETADWLREHHQQNSSDRDLVKPLV